MSFGPVLWADSLTCISILRAVSLPTLHTLSGPLLSSGLPVPSGSGVSVAPVFGSREAGYQRPLEPVWSPAPDGHFCLSSPLELPHLASWRERKWINQISLRLHFTSKTRRQNNNNNKTQTQNKQKTPRATTKKLSKNPKPNSGWHL